MTSVTGDRVTDRLTVLGAGVMGAGIATLVLGKGFPVRLIDIDRAALDRARRDIEAQLRMARLMGVSDGDTGRLSMSTVTADAAGSTAVIEAITERADLKAEALREATRIVRPGTPLVSNTSSIPIAELAAVLDRPEDLAGTHFMNPAYLIGTVEVVRAAGTAQVTMDAVTGLLTALGRVPVVVGDAPGFVTSRILHPMLNAAARVVQAGTATAEAVDTLMRDCLGHRTGPLRTADLIGLDNLVDSLTVLHARTGDEDCLPCDLLLSKVREGSLGRKSGRGFFDYQEAMP
ncbi:3-hydroxyacyl-CoA dehydrogenase [Amycolatopsis orientalis]|uniref:3-hydroxyacyl-CoA dehydrogenase n=1 Tax=Amycolatopsis orientalis TaxID=31958 RepID=A0A193CB71_AMYOR|nr:3-hydroxyacyl-CoA dehydrogenase [Amycolatopsis orientalis]